jgi:signal transduction histidine kinase
MAPGPPAATAPCPISYLFPGPRTPGEWYKSAWGNPAYGRRGQMFRAKKGSTYRLAAAASVAVAGVLAALGLTDLATEPPLGQRIHVAIQTCGALVLCIAALLVFKRFHADVRWRTAGLAPTPQRLADVLLAPALGFLALATVLFSAIPAIIAKNPGAFAIWGQTFGQILGMGAGAVAAWIPRTCIVRRRVSARQTVGVIAAGAMVVAVAALAASQLMHTPDYQPSTLQTDWLPTEIILIVLIATAFVGFARRAERDGDRLMKGFAIAGPLGAGAVVAYALGPGLGAGWLVAEELFLLGAYGAILGGAWAESAAYWSRFLELASAEERRRLARDIHDGLAQDLLYIAVQARRLVEGHPDSASIRGLLYASERAVDESRGAIGTLSYPPGEPLARVLSACVHEVADRAGVVASVRVDGDVELSVEAREAVLRIAREATCNAARHGKATQVLVTLEGSDPVHLTVGDNGVGFDAEAAQREGRGFGLASMQERAQAAGGTLWIWSGPAEGTEISATLPRNRAQLGLAS